MRKIFIFLISKNIHFSYFSMKTRCGYLWNVIPMIIITYVFPREISKISIILVDKKISSSAVLSETDFHEEPQCP